MFELAYLRLRNVEDDRVFAYDRTVPPVRGTYYQMLATAEDAARPIRSLNGKLPPTLFVKLTPEAHLKLVFEAYADRPRMFTVSAGNSGALAKLRERNPRAWDTATVERGLMDGHAYAVIGYDKGTKAITLRNPHNTLAYLGGKDVVLSFAEFRDWFHEGGLSYDK